MTTPFVSGHELSDKINVSVITQHLPEHAANEADKYALL